LECKKVENRGEDLASQKEPRNYIRDLQKSRGGTANKGLAAGMEAKAI